MTFEKRSLVAPSLLVALLTAACSSDSNGGGGNGGAAPAGGQSSASGGSSSGGKTSGGAANTGGASTGGTATGNGGNGSGGQTGANGGNGSAGASSGGRSSGGSSNGGASSGGHSNGGSSNGGASNAGASNGGSGGGAAGESGNSKCPSGSFTGSPIPSGAKATAISGAPPTDSFNMNGFGNVEGPVWIGDSLYFSEMQNGNIPPSRILKIGPGDAVSVFIDSSGSNGLAVDASGNLLAASHGAGGIVRFALPSKAPTTLVSMYGGQRFNSPNDLTVKSDGTIYFTDPDYQNNANPQKGTRVYQLPPNGSTATAITDYTSEPNGITLSLDEKFLFVAGQQGVKKYAINNGQVEMTGTKFGSISQNVDGMVMDCAGNLYLAVGSSTNVVVLDPSGSPVQGSPISVTGPTAVTNVAFGGTDKKTLYITGQGNAGQRGVFKVNLNFPGLPY